MAKREVEGAGVLGRLRARLQRGSGSDEPNGAAPSDDEQAEPKSSWVPDDGSNAGEPDNMAEVRARWLAVATGASHQAPTRSAAEEDDTSSWMPAEPSAPEQAAQEPAEPIAEQPAPEPEVSEPEVSEPEVSEPEVSEPEVPEPAEPEPEVEPEPVAEEPTAPEPEPVAEEPTAPEPEPEPVEPVVAEEANEVPTSRWVVTPQPVETGDMGSWLATGQPSAEPQPTEPTASEPHLPAILAGSRRQRLAVEAYCRELSLATASAAAAEALAEFPGGDDTRLLRHTRSVAARHATSGPTRQGWRQKLSAERQADCASTPALLAARANNELDLDQSEQLERHLESCVACQAAELRAQRADRVFAGIAGIELAEAGRERTAAAQTPAADEEPEPATHEWLPAPEAVAAAQDRAAEYPAIEELAPAAALDETDLAPFSRRGLLAVVAGATAVAAAAAIAIVLITHGTTHNKPLAQVSTPAPVTTPAIPHHKTHARPVVRPHRAAVKKPAAHHAPAAASSAASSSTAAASAASSAASAPAATPAPTPTPTPTPAPAPAPTPAPTPSVSAISQPSLGAAGAKQGIGH